MCIMAIHADAKTANAVQAMAHNADTLQDDLAQLSTLLDARHQTSAGAVIDDLQRQMANTCETLWRLWREYVPNGEPKGSQTATGWEHDRKGDAHIRADAYGSEADASTYDVNA
jgi:hypothetical protein